MATIGPVGTAPSAAAMNASNIDMQDFLNILLTQLTYQDPLKPMDNQAFMAQLAQFTTLGQTQDLNRKIDALVSTQASLQSIGLLGRTVDILREGTAISGRITALSLAGDTPLLTLQTSSGATLTDITLGELAAVR